MDNVSFWNDERMIAYADTLSDRSGAVPPDRLQ